MLTERNAARLKDETRLLPKPVVVVVKVNKQSCRALLDSGSLSDFISTTLVDQLGLELHILDTPLPLQLAVSGSRSKVKANVTPWIEYQDIKEKRRLDVANLDTYDLILGTPFLYQHQGLLGFNPAQVTVRSAESLAIQAPHAVTLESRATILEKDKIEQYRTQLQEYVHDICKEAIDTPLPPLRVINHVIPLLDENKVYSWRPSKCPEALKPLWRAKRDDYVRTGRWEFKSGTNAVPMLMLKKPTKDETLRLRTVLDTRERNANTRKLASLLRCFLIWRLSSVM